MRAWVLSLGLAAVAAGCGGADDAGESSADVTQSSSGYYVATSVSKGGGDLADLTQVKLAGKSKTKCDDGTMQTSCAVALDFTALKLDKIAVETFTAEFNAKHAIVKGKIAAPTIVTPTRPAVAVLKVSAAWMGVNEVSAKSTDKWYIAHSRVQNAACVQPNSCPKFTLHPVNASGSGSDLDVVDVGLDNVEGATSTDLEEADDAMKVGGPGLLVLGSTYYGNGWGMLSATNFFLAETKSIHGLGQVCGGWSGMSCPNGLVCRLPDGHYHPDTSGTCQETTSP